jgi:hypothetical protein
MELQTSRLGDILDTRRAELVLIQDVWVGYHAASPIGAQYVLRRGRSGALSGEGVLSTGLAKEPRRVRVAMKAATASAFLDTLADAELVPGAYAPARTRSLSSDAGRPSRRTGLRHDMRRKYTSWSATMRMQARSAAT